MSNYILMVDSEEESLAHGKFIAKVKGLGGKVRYFYNTNEYMAFLKGGKKSYNSQKTTNQMNKAMNNRGAAVDAASKGRSQQSKYADNKASAERYHKKYITEAMNSGKAADAKAKQEQYNKEYNTKMMPVRNERMNSGKAADAKAKQEALEKQARSRKVTRQMNNGRDALDSPKVTSYADENYVIRNNVIGGREVDERAKQYARDEIHTKYQKMADAKKSGESFNGETLKNFNDAAKEHVNNRLNDWANEYSKTPGFQRAYTQNVEAINNMKRQAFDQQYNDVANEIYEGQKAVEQQYAETEKKINEAKKKNKYVK